MPWSCATPMDQRLIFISDFLSGQYCMRELCELHTISRKTGYKWVRRYQELGVDGLKEQPRRPVHCPHQTPYRIKEELVALRRKHHWGAAKLLTILGNHHPDWPIPARSTACEILRRSGLIKPHKARHHLWGSAQPFAAIDEPNAVWTADFKGQFKLGNRMWCYPLTVADGFSRYLLDVRCLTGTTHDAAKIVFTRLFEQYGLPKRIRTDNGVPFATMSIEGLSRLSLWWLHLGICPERIEPGKPQQNGAHERMHRSLKERTILRPSRSFAAQQKRFDAYREEYNTLRPHEALNMLPPQSCYKPSPRCLPKELPVIKYPPHFEQYLVNHNGGIHRQGKVIYLGYILHGEYVGLNAIADGVWDVYIGPVHLGRYSEEVGKLIHNSNKHKSIRYREV